MFFVRRKTSERTFEQSNAKSGLLTINELHVLSCCLKPLVVEEALLVSESCYDVLSTFASDSMHEIFK